MVTKNLNMIFKFWNSHNQSTARIISTLLRVKISTTIPVMEQVSELNNTHETIGEQLSNSLWMSIFICKPISKKGEIEVNLSSQGSWIKDIELAQYLN